MYMYMSAIQFWSTAFCNLCVMSCSLLVWVLWSTYMYVYVIAFFSHQLSSLGICPFFVENVSSLQLSALRLVRAVSSAFCLCVMIHAWSLLVCFPLRFSLGTRSIESWFWKTFLPPLPDCQPLRETSGTLSMWTLQNALNRFLLPPLSCLLLLRFPNLVWFRGLSMRLQSTFLSSTFLPTPPCPHTHTQNHAGSLMVSPFRW